MKKNKKKKIKTSNVIKPTNTHNNSSKDIRHFIVVSMRFLAKSFAVFAIVLGVVVSLWPRISVEPDNYLDPKNPLKTLFKITNQGFIPLYDLKILSSIKEVKGSGGRQIIGDSNFNSRFFNPVHVSDKLMQSDSDTAYCALGSLNFPFNIEYANIAIIVEYSLPLLSFWRVEKCFPFETYTNIEGNLVLVHRPLNKSNK